jgi:hypothetical protein
MSIIALEGRNYVHLNLMEMNMFSTPFSTLPQYQAHVARAHQMRSEATGRLFGDLFRRIAGLFHIGEIAAAAR